MLESLPSLVVIIAICLPALAQGKQPRESPPVYCGNPEISTSPWLKLSTIEYSIKQGERQTKYFAQFFKDECGLFHRYNDSEPLITTFLLIDSSVLAFKGLSDGESWFDSFEGGNLFLYTTLFGLTRISPSGPAAIIGISGQSSDSKRTLRLSTPGDCHFELSAPWSISGTTTPGPQSTEFSFVIKGKNPNPKLFPKIANFIIRHSGKWSNVPPQANIPSAFDLAGFQFAYLGGPLPIKEAVEGKTFKTLQDLRNAIALEIKNAEAK
jgi:hypothetical protein